MSEEKNTEQIVVTVVESEGESYHLETLLHEVSDRSYLCGMMVEESLLNHPYFKVAEGKEKAKEALAALWNLYLYLQAEGDNLKSKPTGDKTSDHD